MDLQIIMIIIIMLMLIMAVLTVYYGNRFRSNMHKTRHADLTRMLQQQNWPLAQRMFDIQVITGKLPYGMHFFRNGQLNFVIEDSGGKLYPCTNYIMYPYYVSALFKQSFTLDVKPLYGEFVLAQIPTDEKPAHPQNPYALLSFMPLRDVRTKGLNNN